MPAQGEHMRPITPEEALEVLKAEHRYWSANDEAWPDAELTFATTLRDWWFLALIIDSPEWQGVGPHVNALFEIDVSAREWQSTVCPWREKTLRDVCELVAQHARVPVITPAGVLGTSCAAAGAFRWLQRRFGTELGNGERLTPSTTIGEFLQDRWGEKIYDLMLIAPNRVPALRVRRRLRWWNRVSVVSAGVTLGCGLLTCVFPPAILLIPLSLLFFFAGAVIPAYSEDSPPDRVECGELRTVRDLCRVLAPRG